MLPATPRARRTADIQTDFARAGRWQLLVEEGLALEHGRGAHAGARAGQARGELCDEGAGEVLRAGGSGITPLHGDARHVGHHAHADADLRHRDRIDAQCASRRQQRRRLAEGLAQTPLQRGRAELRRRPRRLRELHLPARAQRLERDPEARLLADIHALHMP